MYLAKIGSENYIHVNGKAIFHLIWENLEYLTVTQYERL